MSRNLRLGYTVKSALFLLSASASAIPTGQSPTRRSKRQSGGVSSSLEDSIEDAAHLDKDIREGVNPSSNSDDDDDDDDEDNKRRPSTSATARPTASTTTRPSTSVIASASASSSSTSATSRGGSSTTRNLGIAGGAVAGIVFLLLISFLVYRWKTPKKNNQESWGNEKFPLAEKNHSYQRQLNTPPPLPPLSDKSSQSRGWSETTTIIKPPPLVLVLDGSKKITDDKQTFFFENSSDRSSNLTLTTVYEDMRSPSQDSSISQTAPYPYRNPTVRKLYRSFQPPPIPESPEPMVSRFSWTNNSVGTSVESSPRFRTVTSWVDHQAGRLSVRAKLAEMQLGEEPSTPMEFGHHPGAPVRFLTQHQRLESADLDRQIMHEK